MSLIQNLRDAVAAHYAADSALIATVPALWWKLKPGQVQAGTAMGSFDIKEQSRGNRLTDRTYLQPFDVTLKAYALGQDFDAQAWAAEVERTFIHDSWAVSGAVGIFNVLPNPAALDVNKDQIQAIDMITATVGIRIILQGQD